jgi:hypothetical protein
MKTHLARRMLGALAAAHRESSVPFAHVLVPH